MSRDGMVYMMVELNDDVNNKDEVWSKIKLGMDVTGEITLPEGTEMVMPGDNVTIDVELIYPVACNVGLRFAIREGGRTVGAGQITELEN